MDYVILALACLTVGFLAGYRVAMRHIRTAVDAERERMSRVLEAPFRGGEAHNWSNPNSARVTKARWHTRRRWYMQR